MSSFGFYRRDAESGKKHVGLLVVLLDLIQLRLLHQPMRNATFVCAKKVRRVG